MRGAVADDDGDYPLQDWDSDADENNDGEWVQGKWVGRTHKKQKWWKPILKHQAMKVQYARRLVCFMYL